MASAKVGSQVRITCNGHLALHLGGIAAADLHAAQYVNDSNHDIAAAIEAAGVRKSVGRDGAPTPSALPVVAGGMNAAGG
ncbi:protein of unknown function (plasmid) [Rhodovastum atsumiense]|nr:protein of unknown function [Rhodovastum atsumiense]